MPHIACARWLINRRNSIACDLGKHLEQLIYGCGAMACDVKNFAGDAFHSDAAGLVYILFSPSVIAVGAAGAILSYREGRYLPPGSTDPGSATGG